MNKNPNINKLFKATSHLGESNKRSYCIKPTISYFGINLDFVNDIHAVQAINPYTKTRIAKNEGAITIFGIFFSSHLNIIVT